MIAMYYVYILKCCDKTLYCGYTNDVEKRLESMIMLTLGLAVVISMAFNYRREFNKSRNLTTAVDMKEFANDRQEGDI